MAPLPRLTTAVSKLVTYLVGNSMIVNFPSEAREAFILVTNNDTGEVIHHEIFSSKKAATLQIELEGCYSGNYCIDVNTEVNRFSEVFAL